MLPGSPVHYYDYNTANSLVPVSARSRKLFSQILFSYEFKPRTACFVGYTDNYLGAPSYALTQKDRTLFAKVGYALRF